MTTPESHPLKVDVLGAPRVLRPLERFLHVEAASGFVLLSMAVVALVWANSPAAASYEHLWHLPISFRLGSFAFSETLHFVINDMLMTVFFLVVGLEIRRELYEGALASLRLAALPLVAALGGVIAPALIYLALNTDPELRQGWAVPTATDIAFAVGVLALLGSRVPSSLRVLLLALAIIDDIAAILIIAFFYSSGVQAHGFALAAGGVALVFAFRYFGFRSGVPYVLPGVIVWLGMHEANVHPTLAGVVLGLLTPVRAAAERETLLDMAGHVLTRSREQIRGDAGDSGRMAEPLRRLGNIHREMLSPAERVQMALHPWVAFGIMPLFALANAGVSVQGLPTAELLHSTVGWGVVIGLVVGKPLGIVFASAIAIRLGVAVLPASSSYVGVLLVGCLGGIGFTMAIFIAQLAFSDPQLLAIAKLAVLAASTLSAVMGLLIGWRFLAPERMHSTTALP